MTTAKKLIAAAGAAGAGEATYVEDVFSTYLYDGTGSAQTITNGIDLDGEGGLVWTKGRDYASYHILHDTERGKTKYFLLPDTSASQTDSSGALISSFNNDGYSLGTAGTVNTNGRDYVSWAFRKQPGFFDVVTYTGNGQSTQVINHNLGSTPGMIIQMADSKSGGWPVWHRSLPATNHNMFLFASNASSAGNYFNSATDSTFTVGADSDVNQAGQTYVAYLFAHDAQDFGTGSDESIIKCGSYTGNGNSTGPVIDLGFEPQWVMLKTTASGYGWIIHDTMRGWTADGKPISRLRADQTGAEYNDTNYTEIAVTPTGFRMTGTHPSTNGNGVEYIYVAIRRPHKPASEFAATDLFAMDGAGLNAGAGGQVFESPFPVDAYFTTQPDSNTENYIFDRLRGGGYFLRTNGTNAESNNAYQDQFDHMDGIYTTSAQNYTSWQSWMFRRAPGFFDVVAYTGEAGDLTINHNLGVVPELIISKARNNTRNWAAILPTTVTGASSGTNFSTAYFDLTNNFIRRNYSPGPLGNWLASAATETSYTWAGNTSGGNAEVNYAGWTYINYLFATVPGISKVGSYTGTGSNVDVNCGFTSGAKFVLVKRTDSTGDWYLWDSERGIVAGNDPYFLVNSSSAQVTSTDYIDPLSSGFTITSSAPAALNASGGSYLFLAIA